MPDLFRDVPGRLALVAALLPLAAAVLIAAGGFVRSLAGRRLPTASGAYLAVGCMVVAAACAVSALVLRLNDEVALADQPMTLAARWGERVDWLRVGAAKVETPATVLRLGYRVDRLTALMTAMVTVIGSLIFVFSFGYMKEEREPTVSDHEAHTTRRGRFGRFFLYLSLFAFSMLALLISDNLFQVFCCWELVGLCSYCLIGFYTERGYATAAATKAFVVNRVGDAGFLAGLMALWATVGTFDLAELTTLFATGHPATVSTVAWWVIGLGLFCGAVGKSAQVPLHTWLPDAMAGPTPVSALIHAATMVAAGVYLVGRAYPLFSPDVKLVIAYTGAVTLFVSATIACVQTDLKRILAFSTGSQLGYMMLALGVGGWAAGLFHLLTHAFFKALLFLAAGSVIHALHHEQDLRRMGGLKTKLPVTAWTMLVGVLAIAGVPLLSGWYSKDAVLAAALGFSLAEPNHALLFFLPLVTAGLTAFYMLRLWLLAFTGPPRDKHLHDHAHESPTTMTGPLVVLAAFAIAAGWGLPPWDAEESYLGHLLHDVEPAAGSPALSHARHLAHERHLFAGGLALIAGAVGAGVALTRYMNKPATVTEPTGGVARFLFRRWRFDDLYDAVFLKPVLRLGTATAAADKRDADTLRLDPGTLDGWLAAPAVGTVAVGRASRAIQGGRVRGYVLALALTVAGVLGMLTAFSQ